MGTTRQGVAAAAAGIAGGVVLAAAVAACTPQQQPAPPLCNTYSAAVLANTKAVVEVGKATGQPPLVVQAAVIAAWGETQVGTVPGYTDNVYLVRAYKPGSVAASATDFYRRYAKTNPAMGSGPAVAARQVQGTAFPYPQDAAANGLALYGCTTYQPG